jgi:hypothetical protein
MPLPTYVVELQFGSSGYVDVTQYVQNVSINRGINRNLDDFSAGSVSVTFVNNNRVFDPLNTSSPLWFTSGGYTLVQPAGRIRISSNGVRRFTGFVQDWDFAYEDSGFDGQATLTALDLMYRVSNAAFTGGTAWQVESTSDRIKTVMNYNGFGAFEYAGVRGGQTLLGYDSNQPGDNVLAYLQNVARSEPADFYSNASAVMQLKDRSFTNYAWNNTLRQNLIKYPNELSQDTTIVSFSGGTGLGDGWVLGWQPGTAAPYYAGGTVNTAEVSLSSFRSFYYQDVNQTKFNPSGTATQYVFSGWFRGQGLTGAGIIGSFALLDSNANSLVSSGMFASAATGNDWTNMGATATYSGTGIVAGIRVSTDAPGTGTVYNYIANGWQVEQGTAIPNYFDGAYDPYASSASTAYEIAWAGIPYASESGLLTSVATAVTAPTVLTFADANSQGTAYGNGTGIPFTDLEVVYASEQLYNKVQVVGVNATAVVEDTASQLLYGLRGYGQTDNLTTSTSKPASIASAFLGEFRMPEYRAQALTVALESLTTTQQTAVLGIEIRDVVRVCFQPSAQGAVVDKLYQVLGVNSNTDVERDAVTLNLASLDNLPFRLDSPYLGVLDTGTLA